MVNPIDWNGIALGASKAPAQNEDTPEFLDFPPLDAFSFKIIDLEDFWPMNPPDLRVNIQTKTNLT